MAAAAEYEAAVAAELRPILVGYGLGDADGLIEDLAGVMSRVLARQIEAACRTPVSQRGPGRLQPETRNQRAGRYRDHLGER